MAASGGSGGGGSGGGIGGLLMSPIKYTGAGLTKFGNILSLGTAEGKDALAVGAMGALSIFGSVFDYIGQKYQRDAQTQAYKAEIAILNNEASINAKAGAEESFERREILRKTLSRNVAKTAASGVLMEGSPIQAQLNAIQNAAYDVSNIKYNTAVRDYSIRQRIESLKYANKQNKKAGKLALVSSAVGLINPLAGIAFQSYLANKGSKNANA